MACYVNSVLTRLFSSMYSGAGSEPSSDQMTKQVVIASSVTNMDVNDLPETTYDMHSIAQPTNRKGGDTDKVIFIPEDTAIFIAGKAQSAFVSTRTIGEGHYACQDD